MDLFDFCPDSQVPQTLPPEATKAVSMNGWEFTARPTVPYQKKFKVMLHGLKWFLNPTTGLFDTTSSPTINARRLELFYEAHGQWDPFTWNHPHMGPLTVRFASGVLIPPGTKDSGGLIADPVEINLIHHNPGFS